MYEFSGKVIRGEGRGRQLGWPTANLDNHSLPLNHGVYLVKVSIAQRAYQGLLHYGPKKTFNDLISTEVFIQNFNQDIYGRVLKISVIKKLRPILKFKSVDELLQQLEQDKAQLN